MPKCTMLVGVPGSGKSTWLQTQYNYYVASTDNIIEQIAGGFDMTYNESFPGLINFAEKVMWKELETFVKLGWNIAIDRTNLSAKSRKKFIDKLKLHGYDIECVVFHTPEPEEWKRRLDSRPGKTIPQEALDRMVDSYEIPLMSEGFTSITYA